MAQVINPAYIGASQWTPTLTCNPEVTRPECKTPWWFLVGVLLAAAAGGTKRAMRRRAQRKGAVR